MAKTVSENVVIFSKEGCPFCIGAKKALEEHGYDYVEYIPDGDDKRLRTVRALSGKSTSPQIFIDGKYVGGFDDLKVFLKI